MTDPEERLPQWARAELKRLRSDLAWATAKLTAGPDDSDTFASPYVSPRPLGRGEPVQFHLPGGRIVARIRDGVLDINCAPGSLIVRLRAANAVEIETGDR